MGRSVARVARRLQQPLAVGAAVLGLLVVCALPLAMLAGRLLVESPSLRAFHNPVLWLLLGRSLLLSLAVAALAALIGVPMGAALAKLDVRARRLAWLLHSLPLLLPPFFSGLGWFHTWSERGLLGSASTSAWLFSDVGVVLTLGLCFAPILSLLTALGLEGVDPVLQQAAEVVAPPARVLVHILLPLAARSIALGLLLVFSLALSEVGVPLLLRVRTYSGAVFSRLGGADFDPAAATVLVLPLLVVGLSMAWLERRALGLRSVAALGAGVRGARPLQLAWPRWVVSGLVWLVVIVLAWPVVAVVARAGASGLGEALRWLGSSMVTSVMLAAVAASAITMLGVVLGHAIVRGQALARRVEPVAVLAFVVPAAVLSSGLIFTWNQRSTSAVYGSLAILVLALTGRYAVLGVRAVVASFGQVPAHYEDVASVFGASYLQRLLRVLAPLRSRALATIWLLGFLACLRDLDTVVACHPPGLDPLPVRVFTLEANAPAQLVAGLASCQVLFTVLLLALATALAPAFRGRS